MENPTPILEKLEWTPIRSGKANPEAIFKCDRCSKETLTHPNYRKFGIVACVLNRTTCYKIEEVAQKMVEVRGWKYVNTDKKAKNQIVSFICEEGHEQNLTYESLRKGCGCKNCYTVKITKPKVEREKLVRPNCGCKIIKNTKDPILCPHYNHKVDPAGGAEEWNYEMNSGIVPENIAPSSGKYFWYRCSNEWCGMSYQQKPTHRRDLVRCPYCSGTKTCEWNCLLTNYPELCEELDPNNEIKPTNVTPGSKIKLNWICNKHEIPFRFSSEVCHRVAGNGCPMCNTIGYKQRIGGMEVFVEDARKIHGDKYIYNDDYRGSHIPIAIYCPSISKSCGEVHGEFLQTPHNHKSGNICPKCSSECKESKLIKSIRSVLKEFQIKHVTENRFPDLICKQVLPVDVYIPKHNMIIEGDGEQHFNPRGFHREQFETNRKRDLIKDKYCVEKGISLIRIPYTKNLDSIKIIISAALCLSKENRHILITYKEFYEENKILIGNSRVQYIEINR